jgi:hypothetical protein
MQRAARPNVPNQIAIGGQRGRNATRRTDGIVYCVVEAAWLMKLEPQHV